MRAFLALAALWTLGILAACLVPGDQIPEVDFALVDKVTHVVLFAGFGLLWLRVAPRRRAAVVGWGLALAVAIELLQSGLPINRSGDALDVVADALGLAVALVADAAWQRLRPARRRAEGLATGPRGRP